MTFNWDEAREIVKQRDYARLVRTDAQLQEYLKYMDECRTRYLAVDDYLRHVVFGWRVSSVAVDGGARLKADEPAMRDRQVIFKFNDYPYAFTPDVLHYCLWSTHEMTEAQVDTHLAQSLNARTHEWLWFCNPPSQKSIRTIWHIHCLVRRLSNVEARQDW